MLYSATYVCARCFLSKITTVWPHVTSFTLWTSSAALLQRETLDEQYQQLWLINWKRIRHIYYAQIYWPSQVRNGRCRLFWFCIVMLNTSKRLSFATLKQKNIYILQLFWQEWVCVSGSLVCSFRLYSSY